MNRISLTRRDERTLPVNINGQDIDLTFDAGTQTKETLIAMMDDIMKYREEGKSVIAGIRTDGSETDMTENISKVRAFTEQGRLLCSQLSTQIGTFCPRWAEVIGNNFISLEVYGDIIEALITIIGEKETTDKVKKEAEEER